MTSRRSWPALGRRALSVLQQSTPNPTAQLFSPQGLRSPLLPDDVACRFLGGDGSEVLKLACGKNFPLDGVPHVGFVNGPENGAPAPGCMWAATSVMTPKETLKRKLMEWKACPEMKIEIISGIHSI